MSYLTQMLALTGQNFFSAATGIAVAFAPIRGFSVRSAQALMRRQRFGTCYALR